MNIEHLLTDLFFFFGKIFVMWLFYFSSKFYVTDRFNKYNKPSILDKALSFCVIIGAAFIIGVIADSHMRERGIEILLSLALPGCIGLVIGYGNVKGIEHREKIKKIYDKMDQEKTIRQPNI